MENFIWNQYGENLQTFRNSPVFLAHPVVVVLVIVAATTVNWWMLRMVFLEWLTLCHGRWSSLMCRSVLLYTQLLSILHTDSHSDTFHWDIRRLAGELSTGAKWNAFGRLVGHPPAAEKRRDRKLGCIVGASDTIMFINSMVTIEISQ